MSFFEKEGLSNLFNKGKREEQENKAKEEQEKKGCDPIQKFVKEKMGLDPKDFDFSYKTVAEIEPDPEKEGNVLGTFKEFSNYHDLLEFRNGLSQEQKDKMDKLYWGKFLHFWNKITVLAQQNFWDKKNNPEDPIYQHRDEFNKLIDDIKDEKIEDEYARKKEEEKSKLASGDIEAEDGTGKEEAGQEERKLTDKLLSLLHKDDKKGCGLKGNKEAFDGKIEQPAGGVEQEDGAKDIEKTKDGAEKYLDATKDSKIPEVKRGRKLIGGLLAALILSASGGVYYAERKIEEPFEQKISDYKDKTEKLERVISNYKDGQSWYKEKTEKLEQELVDAKSEVILGEITEGIIERDYGKEKAEELQEEAKKLFEAWKEQQEKSGESQKSNE